MASAAASGSPRADAVWFPGGDKGEGGVGGISMSPSSRPIAWRTGVDANDESCTTSTSSLGVEAAVVYDDEAALFARPSGPPSQRAQNWMGVRPSLRAKAAGSRMRGVALHWSQCRSVRVHPLSIYSPNCRVSSALSSRNVELCLEARLLTQLSGKHKCHDYALTMADVSSSLDDMLRSAMGMSKVARREGQGSVDVGTSKSTSR